MRKLLLLLCLALVVSVQVRAETITLLAEDDWYPYTGKLASDKVGIRKTLANRADVVVVYDMVAKDLLRKMKVTDQLKVVGEASVADIYLAFSRTFPDSERIRTLFDKGFAEIQKNGRYQQIMQEWDALFE